MSSESKVHTIGNTWQNSYYHRLPPPPQHIPMKTCRTFKREEWSAGPSENGTLQNHYHLQKEVNLNNLRSHPPSSVWLYAREKFSGDIGRDTPAWVCCDESAWSGHISFGHISHRSVRHLMMLTIAVPTLLVNIGQCVAISAKWWPNAMGGVGWPNAMVGHISHRSVVCVIILVSD